MGELAMRTQGRQLQKLDAKHELQKTVRDHWPQIAKVIGDGMDPEMLLQYCISAINREPALAQCTDVSVLSCFMQCAALGLKPSNVDGLGQAYILPYGNKYNKGGGKQATFVIGYKGMIHLLEHSGIYARPQAVYKDDGISLKVEPDGSFTLDCPHEVNLEADHSPVNLSFVYLNVNLPNGGRYSDYMSRRDLEEYRDRYAPRKNGAVVGPWVTDFVAMGLKTLVRQAFKYLPVSVEAKKAVSVDETTPEYPDVFDAVVEPDPEPAQQPGFDQQEAPDDEAGGAR